MKRVVFFVLFLFPLFVSAQTYRSVKQEILIAEKKDTLILCENEYLIRFLKRTVEVENVKTGRIDLYDKSYDERWNHGEIIYHTHESVLVEPVDFTVKRVGDSIKVVQDVLGRWGVSKRIKYYIEE